MSVNEFTLNHVFTKVVELPEIDIHVGETEKFGNMSWRITGFWTNKPYFFKISLECVDMVEDLTVEVSVASESIEKITKIKKNFTFSSQKSTQMLASIELDEVNKARIEKDLPIDVTIKINKINGKRLNSRDFSEKKYSDVVLIVKNEKFHVSKLYLSSHSTYFESLLMGNFEESGKSEIELQDIDPTDFQNFLDFIHAECDIDDDTVDGILHLADFFDAKTVVRRCENYLIGRSGKSNKLKFEAAIKYRLNPSSILRNNCISNMKTKEDVISAAPSDPTQFDSAVWAELFHKLASFS